MLERRVLERNWSQKEGILERRTRLWLEERSCKWKKILEIKDMHRNEWLGMPRKLGQWYLHDRKQHNFLPNFPAASRDVVIKQHNYLPLTSVHNASYLFFFFSVMALTIQEQLHGLSWLRKPSYTIVYAIPDVRLLWEQPIDIFTNMFG